MSLIEKYFKYYENELNVAASSFYAWKSINNIAVDDKDVYNALNRNALFWNITQHSLQCTFFISLGRIFDIDDQAFSIHKLLKACIENITEFSESHLRERKKGNGPEPDWLDDYMKGIYIPSENDFQRLRGEVSKQRKIYVDKLQSVRHKVFAHTDLLSIEKTHKFFAEATIGDIQDLLKFLFQIKRTIFELYHNGRKGEIGEFHFDEEEYVLKDISSLMNLLKQKSPTTAL